MKEKKEKQFLTRHQLFEVLLEAEKKYRISPKQYIARADLFKEDAITVAELVMEHLNNIAKELGFIK